ncbi:Uncharacterised protein [Corynebacterium matruchotii]|nr:Uncharacterised protein [Corynebacterium matruchotii]
MSRKRSRLTGTEALEQEFAKVDHAPCWPPWESTCPTTYSPWRSPTDRSPTKTACSPIMSAWNS